MFLPSLTQLFIRDLAALDREVQAYPDDALPWRVVPGISNSGGNLILHLTGNLQHFVGACLGGSGYVRDRAAEFNTRDLPRTTLQARVAAARDAVASSLPHVSETVLRAPFPEPIGGFEVETADFLLHLLDHFAYHLGQIDYHRSIVTGQRASLGVIAVGELHSARKL